MFDQKDLAEPSFADYLQNVEFFGQTDLQWREGMIENCLFFNQSHSPFLIQTLVSGVYDR